jgi:Protein of unknown function (DUF1353)
MKFHFARRSFLRASSVLAADTAFVCGLGSFFNVAVADTKEFAADGGTIEVWMDQWIKNDKKPIGALHVSRFADPIYFLIRPIKWTPNPGQEAFQPVTVPVGFVTDFASIPRVFWSLLRPDGKYTYPAIVHDYLYWTQTRPKGEADEILKFGMEDFAVEAISSATIYDAVRLFGGIAWKDNAQLKANGERRILKRFPDDPTTTWGQWKKRPDVFE